MISSLDSKTVTDTFSMYSLSYVVHVRISPLPCQVAMNQGFPTSGSRGLKTGDRQGKCKNQIIFLFNMLFFFHIHYSLYLLTIL